jgi:two-component system sensor histidine kinase KdpD
VLASLASVGAFDFFLVPPYFSLSVDESEYWVTFAVMLNTAILISTLTARVTQQSELANQLAQQAEFERLKNSLLSSVSHDVRTPLATITGAASSLMCSQALQQLPHEHELSVAIYEEAE